MMVASSTCRESCKAYGDGRDLLRYTACKTSNANLRYSVLTVRPDKPSWQGHH